ncbi:NAD(P)H-dependent flavin oxidoreductase [Nonomuraea harbinensis]|uniref:NAD(P)H-dependent flavin oxidoreductase n=1 Tax=Nonomuraea harbinensis TaxID=1286938 RepID=A0ABW1C0E3_9ACTN|nr:hypothetical protein [Nonomuraea harbinensis]
MITSVGSPAAVTPALRDAGIQVWCDVATVHHAQRAADAGADGLILLTAGAGGQTGNANPFAFVRAVRERFDGIIALSLTNALSGLETNLLRRSLLAQGLDPAEFGIGPKRFSMAALEGREGGAPKRWRDIWSAGHSVSGVRDVPSVAELVDRLAREYGEAAEAMLALASGVRR